MKQMSALLLQRKMNWQLYIYVIYWLNRIKKIPIVQFFVNSRWCNWIFKSFQISCMPNISNIIIKTFLWKAANTGKPSSLKISLVACIIPVYFDGPYEFLWSKAHCAVGSSWTCQYESVQGLVNLIKRDVHP